MGRKDFWEKVLSDITVSKGDAVEDSIGKVFYDVIGCDLPCVDTIFGERKLDFQTNQSLGNVGAVSGASNIRRSNRFGRISTGLSGGLGRYGVAREEPWLSHGS